MVILGVDRERALELLRGGAEGVGDWNRWRKNGPPIPSLAHAHLVDYDLSDADLRACDLQGAKLLRTILFGAKLDDTDLRKADMRRTDLSYASLVRARLLGANLSESRMYSTDMRQTRLEGAILSQVETDTQTRWPEGFSPSKHGIAPWP